MNLIWFFASVFDGNLVRDVHRNFQAFHVILNFQMFSVFFWFCFRLIIVAYIFSYHVYIYINCIDYFFWLEQKKWKLKVIMTNDKLILRLQKMFYFGVFHSHLFFFVNGLVWLRIFCHFTSSSNRFLNVCNVFLSETCLLFISRYPNGTI